MTRRRPLSRVPGLLVFPRMDEATSWWRKAAEQWAARGVLNVGLLHPRRPVRSPVVPNWKRFWRSLLVTLTRDARGVSKDVAAGFGVSRGVGRSANASEKPVKQLDWQATEERAARMTDRELVGAIRDARRAAKIAREIEKVAVRGQFKTQAYYHDLMSVYSKELKLRAPAAASGLKD